MVVILEGPDGAGKTTLAQAIQAKLPFEYRHEGPPPRGVDALEYYGAALDKYRGRNVILDRFALGERVYGPVLRQHDGLGADGWEVFRRLLEAMGVKEVICLPPPEVAYINWRNRKGELFTDDRQFYETYARFAYLTLDLGYATFDYTSASTDQVLEFVREGNGWGELLPNVVGAPDAKYLIVGEVGSNPNALHDLPFFSTTGSSAYLTKALHQAGYQEKELMWVNAYQHSGAPNVLPKKNFFGEELQAIALGARAQQACQDQGIKYRGTVHPAYWKRFHSKDYAGYVSRLQELR